MKFEGKRIAVLGFGVEGQSSAKYLAKKGANITVLDKKNDKDYLSNLSSFDIIVRSPGVKRNLPEILTAEKSGVDITSQTKLFFDLCPAKIIGVTGTKGKGTTASLIYEMLKEQKFSAYLGGNIGNAPFAFLDILFPQDWVVLELSSFQLEDLGRSPADAANSAEASMAKKAMAGKPHIAVMLMITKDHLGKDDYGTQNYHETIMEYVDAKRNLVRYQKKTDFAILNRDYVPTHESDIHTKAQVFQVSRERGMMQQGCFVEDGKIVVQRFAGPVSLHPVGTRSSLAVKDGANELRAAGVPALATRLTSAPRITRIEIMDTKDLLLPGKHNWENVCAAVMAATLAGVSKENIVSVLKMFKGLEHRLELVGEVNGVKYYDDSFSTTPETAIAAIMAFKNPEILILGGATKGSDFTELGQIIGKADNIKAIIGIGVEWPRMKAQFPISNFQFPIIERLGSMFEIVKKASEIARPGDVVLLSPACTSFDMFANYKERGEQFRKEVLRLSA